MKSVGPDSRLQYYRLSAAEVLKDLKSHKMGLTNAEAGRRFGEDGPNAFNSVRFPVQPISRAWAVLQPAVGLLLAGALLAAQQQQAWLVFVFVAAAITRVAISTLVLGDKRADIRSLNRYVPAHARVLRNGDMRQIATMQLAIGDIVQLRQGDMTPADLRLLTAQDLIMDDHALLGGSIRTHKFTHALAPEVPLVLRNNLALAGSQVVDGEAYGIVTAVGADTELGRVMTLQQTVERAPSSMRLSVEHYERYISWLAAATALIALGAGVLLGIDWQTEVPILLSLLLAGGVPTLPIIASVMAAITNWRLNRSGFHASNPAPGLTLGKTSLLLFNTAGFMDKAASVRRFVIGRTSYSLSDGIFSSADNKKLRKKDLLQLRLFFEAAAFSYHHNDVLAALSSYAGFDAARLDARHQRLKSLPYDAHRQVGSVVRQYGNDTVVFVHGSPEAVLRLSSKIWDHGHVRTISVRDSVHHTGRHAANAAAGMHTVALAYRILPKRTNVATLATAEAEQKLTFLGTVDTELATYEHAHQLLAAVAGSGLHVSLLVTEPHAYTISSARLRAMNDAQLAERLEKGTATFSMLTGEDKLRLVNVGQLAGHSVCIVGATLDDLPAMKAADGALAASANSVPDVWRAADALLDQPAAVAEARRANRYQPANLAHALAAARTASLASLLLVLVSAAYTYVWHIPATLNALQLAIFGMVLYPVITIALARDRQQAEHAERLRVSLLFGLVAALSAYANYLLFFSRIGLEPAYIDPTSSLQAHAATLALVTLALCAWINLLFVRVENVRHARPAQFFYAPVLLAGLLSLAILLAILYIPGASLALHTQSLSAADWLVTVLLGSVFAASHLIQRHTRHHTRRAVVALHRQVHGKAAHSRV